MISLENAFFTKRNNKSTSQKIATLPFYILQIWAEILVKIGQNVLANQTKTEVAKKYQFWNFWNNLHTSWCKFRLCGIRHKIFFALG